MLRRTSFGWLRAIGLACALATALFVPPSVPAAEVEITTDPLPEDCMPSSEVRAGMVGEGRTVFEGYEVGRFKASILGVQHNPMAGGNMILARLEGRYLEQHGVVAGMSGSPVFVDGKCIGAVAYGWTFAYAPYCGITPIESMWSVWQAIGKPGATERDQEQGSARLRGQPWDWRAAWATYQQQMQGNGPASPLTAGFRPELPELSDVQGEMRPLWSPIFVSGASPRAEKRLRDFLGGQGIEVMGAGSLAGSAAAADLSDRPGEPAPEIQHGSALGVPILTGDMTVSSVGTVTYRRGNKLIAFGHPMFGEGGVAAPMAQAYIYGFMQSYSRSFKLGEVRGVVGTIDQDRLFAIGGQFGEGPPRVPISVAVHGPATFRPRTYHFSAWDNRRFLPMVSSIAFDEAYTASAGQGGRLTARSRYRIALKSGEVIEKAFLNSDEGYVVDEPITSMLQDLFLLIENPFRRGQIASIDVDVQLDPGLRQDMLVSAALEHSTLLAGDVARVQARLRPYQGDEYTRTFEIPLASDLRPGPYVLHVADATASIRMAQVNRPELFDPRDFAEVVRLIGSTHVPGNRLQLSLYEPAVDVAVRGQALNGLPPSMQALVVGTAAADEQAQPIGKLLAEQAFTLPGPVGGSASLLINIVDHFDE